MSSISNTAAARSMGREAAGTDLMRRIAYGATLAAVYGAFGFLWYFAAKEKLMDDAGSMPAGLAAAYDGTFVASFPGVDVAWIGLGVLQAITLLVLAASLLRGEFLPSRQKPLLVGALSASLLMFALLIFGQQLTANHDSVAQLFGYLAATGVSLLIVLALPPSRGLRWLPAGADER